MQSSAALPQLTVKAIILGILLSVILAGANAYLGLRRGIHRRGGLRYLGTNLSPALMSVGYIAGINIAVLVLLGGATSWYAAIPLCSTFFMDANPEILAAFQAGTPAADLAGLITGEALIGIFMALPIVITGSSDVLAIAAEPFHGKPRLVVLGILAWMLYRIARGPQRASTSEE